MHRKIFLLIVLLFICTSTMAISQYDNSTVYEILIFDDIGAPAAIFFGNDFDYISRGYDKNSRSDNGWDNQNIWGNRGNWNNQNGWDNQNAWGNRGNWCNQNGLSSQNAWNSQNSLGSIDNWISQNEWNSRGNWYNQSRWALYSLDSRDNIIKNGSRVYGRFSNGKYGWTNYICIGEYTQKGLLAE